MSEHGPTEHRSFAAACTYEVTVYCKCGLAFEGSAPTLGQAGTNAEQARAEHIRTWEELAAQLKAAQEELAERDLPLGEEVLR